MARTIPVPRRKPRYKLGDLIVFEDCDGSLIETQLVAGVRNPDSFKDDGYYLVKSKIGKGDANGTLVIPVCMTKTHVEEWNAPNNPFTFIFKEELVIGEHYLWVREDRIRDHWRRADRGLEVIIEQIRKEIHGTGI